MFLFRETIGWLFVAALIVGVTSLGMSYRIRQGRSENMLVGSLKRGLTGGLLALAVLVPILLLVAWLRG
jgi:hypothetical protein